MLSRSKMLGTIDKGYAARMKGDKELVATIWAKGAKYRLVANPADFRRLPVGRKNAVEATSSLIDMIKFKSLKRVDVLVDGNRAAVHWLVTVSVGRGKPVKTELCDLWTFNPAGKATELIQFVDTALLAKLVG